MFQGGEGEVDRGRHNGEAARPVQHDRDHGKGRGEDALRRRRLPGVREDEYSYKRNEKVMGQSVWSFQIFERQIEMCCLTLRFLHSNLHVQL